MRNILVSPGDMNQYTQYTFADFWKLNHKQYKLSKLEARDTMRKFAQLVHEEMLNNPDGFKIPRIGTLIIFGIKTDTKISYLSTKEKRVEFRNVKTDRVCYFPTYIWGKNRGKCRFSLLWNIKSTVPLRKKIKQKIDNNDFNHWFILKNRRDAPMYDISPELRKDAYQKRNSKQVKKLNQGS